MKPLPSPTPSPIPIPTSEQISATADAEPEEEVSLRELEQPAIPVIGEPITRVRETLGGIASTPRRRATLIIIQAITSAFAFAAFSYLILRKE